MPSTCYDYVDPQKRASELGLKAPAGIVLLPRNFETATSVADLEWESSVADVRKLLKEQGLVETRIDKTDAQSVQVAQKDASWMGPTVLFTTAAISQNPLAIQIAVKVMADYVSRLFLGSPSRRTARFDIVVQKPTGGYVRVHFEGDVASAREVVEFAERILKADA